MSAALAMQPALRFFDTGAQIRREYPHPPTPLAFEQAAEMHPWTQRFDIPLTASPCRAPISPESELMHVDSEGDCLVPFVPAGRKYHIFDASLPAGDGDYVLVEASAELRSYLNLVFATNPDWRAKYSSGVPDVWIKQLRLVDGAAAWAASVLLQASMERSWSKADMRQCVMVFMSSTLAHTTPDDEQIVAELRDALTHARAAHETAQ